MDFITYIKFHIQKGNRCMIIILNIFVCLIIGIGLSAILHGGNIELSDGFLAVVIGLLIQLIQTVKKNK